MSFSFFLFFFFFWKSRADETSNINEMCIIVGVAMKNLKCLHVLLPSYMLLLYMLHFQCMLHTVHTVEYILIGRV